MEPRALACCPPDCSPCHISGDRWRKNFKTWLCPILLLAVCLGFYSVFNRVPDGSKAEDLKEAATVCRQAETGERPGRKSSDQEGHVLPQTTPDLHSSLRESDCCVDTCRVAQVPRMSYPKAQLFKPPRVDVLVMTPWFAPIVWDGTFDIAILDEQFRNTTIGLTVFAMKKYVVFLQLFLETAEQYFMVGHRVTYFVFTDRPADVPAVALGPGRQVVVLQAHSYARWQDVSMRRMEMINELCAGPLVQDVRYLVCLDVDMRFGDHVGVEILSPLFGTLHPSFYGAERQSFTYERRPHSRAFIPEDEGDFYYAGGFFGGSVAEVRRLTAACHQAMLADRDQGIEALWHDESYLNRYLLYHKPTRVLSPEYLWDEMLKERQPFLRKLRFLAVPKDHGDIRA